jgi:RNA polymerase sigma factor (TIGR02999 family)
LAGQRQAREQLLAQCYGEIRVIAARVLRGEGQQLCLQPTDLAHEAAIRLMKINQIDYVDRAHFLAMSARVIRQVLIDEVRKRKAAKRARPDVMTMWPDQDTPRKLPLDEFDEALCQLAAIDADRARIVELRFYGGLTVEEVAVELDVSVRTIRRRWAAARAWLLAALADLD